MELTHKETLLAVRSGVIKDQRLTEMFTTTEMWKLMEVLDSTDFGMSRDDKRAVRTTLCIAMIFRPELTLNDLYFIMHKGTVNDDYNITLQKVADRAHLALAVLQGRTKGQ